MPENIVYPESICNLNQPLVEHCSVCQIQSMDHTVIFQQFGNMFHALGFQWIPFQPQLLHMFVVCEHIAQRQNPLVRDVVTCDVQGRDVRLGLFVE